MKPQRPPHPVDLMNARHEPVHTELPPPERYRFRRLQVSNQRTHWEGCWREPSHHACAVALIERQREALESMVHQFAYWSENGPGLWTGGLSALEDAFEVLGWEADLHPMPDMACDEPGCTKQQSCGWPSDAGYRLTCGEHMKPVR